MPDRLRETGAGQVGGAAGKAGGARQRSKQHQFQEGADQRQEEPPRRQDHGAGGHAEKETIQPETLEKAKRQAVQKWTSRSRTPTPSCMRSASRSRLPSTPRSKFCSSPRTSRRRLQACQRPWPRCKRTCWPRTSSDGPRRPSGTRSPKS